jgi:CDP-glucose 4,6-dehydratase
MKFNQIEKFYKNKKVLIIGHTGFKGSWLTLCLRNLGSQIHGISNDVPTTPSHFILSKINKDIKDHRADIRNYKNLKRKIISIKPDIIFHFAAQSLVKESFNEPYKTWTTNLMGSINIFEFLRSANLTKKTSVVIITSDKCYKNLNKKKGYIETDELGDSEPYGASKAAVELAFRSYFDSFFKDKKNIKIATARAGNVIGGGDWSKNRILPDLFRTLNSKKKLLKIRYPNSTRPWQHVLEPIYGYMYLALNLHQNKKNTNGESFNFGPKFIKNYKVTELLVEIKKYLPQILWKIDSNKKKVHEAGLLNLNSNKTFKILKWKNILNFAETVEMTAEWYNKYFKNNDVREISLKQINQYQIKLKKNK